MIARRAEAADAAAIARIYDQGIEDRGATFETRPRSESDVREWFAGAFPVAVACDDGRVLAFASTSAYSSRACYSHIADFSVYTDRSARRRGAGKAALAELIRLARESGFRKLTSKVFVENTASRTMLKSLGFRELGTHVRHGQVDGEWHDVVVVELLL
ncbi:MAG: arsinothricin resistance N-acetyltransferase ArsN1 family A [Myxococcales bacterium]|nr:arsinothricin resistance N-acetyltransferase ArsN1 [Myxococcales bacterium]